LELKEDIEEGKDYIVIARKPAAEMDFSQVKSSLIHVLKRSKSLNFKMKKQ
jgi:ribonuclease P protein component